MGGNFKYYNPEFVKTKYQINHVSNTRLFPLPFFIEIGKGHNSRKLKNCM